MRNSFMPTRRIEKGMARRSRTCCVLNGARKTHECVNALGYTNMKEMTMTTHNLNPTNHATI